jgi:hypothetical protein
MKYTVYIHFMYPTFVNSAHTTAALWWLVGEIFSGTIFFVYTGTEKRSTSVQMGRNLQMGRNRVTACQYTNSCQQQNRAKHL